MKKFKLTVIAISLVVLGHSNFAVAPLKVGELADLCKDYSSKVDSSENLQCARYLKGFIDGAITIDSRVASNDDKKISDFKERALRTRVGSRIERLSKPENDDFCLGRPLPLSEVIYKVKDEIQLVKNLDEPALFSVYKVLSKYYPCDK